MQPSGINSPMTIVSMVPGKRQRSHKIHWTIIFLQDEGWTNLYLFVFHFFRCRFSQNKLIVIEIGDKIPFIEYVI